MGYLTGGSSKLNGNGQLIRPHRKGLNKETIINNNSHDLRESKMEMYHPFFYSSLIKYALNKIINVFYNYRYTVGIYYNTVYNNQADANEPRRNSTPRW